MRSAIPVVPVLHHPGEAVSRLSTKQRRARGRRRAPERIRAKMAHLEKITSGRVLTGKEHVFANALRMRFHHQLQVALLRLWGDRA
jgi:hypothetical protein